jgi:hypothetical protein
MIHDDVWGQQQVRGEKLEWFTGLGGAEVGLHQELPLFGGELSGFVDEESGDIVDDGVGEPGLGAGADEGVLIEHEFGV